jgi:shikimate dehydrogenase
MAVMLHPERFFLAGVMGWPVLHSRSPKLHNYWLQAHQMLGAYVPLAVKPSGLAPALRALAPLGFCGCNLTLPHKEAALSFVDTVDRAARQIGAINCVVVRPDGSLFGQNTDGFGFLNSILEAHPYWRAGNGPIVVLGAGGAGRAVLVALAQQGAREIRLINRTMARAKALEAEFGAPIKAVGWEERHAALTGAGTLVNATSLGMVGQPALDLILDDLPRNALVTDLVYAPLITPLLAAAERRGNPIVGGLGMLLHQARPAFSAWFGVMPEVTSELRCLIEASL